MTNENEIQLTNKQRTMIMATLMLGGFIAPLDETIINVAFNQLTTIGFGGLIFDICSIEKDGLLNAMVLISLVLEIGGSILFSKCQLALAQPMLELRVFSYPMFTLGALIIFINFMMPFAVNIILPTYMQTVLGMTPFTAGLALYCPDVC